MAAVKFYGMTLDFQYVRDCYNDQSFARFIFQPFLHDAEKWRDEFCLLVYALNQDGEMMNKRDLTVVENDTYEAFNRLELGNIALTRNQLKPFIDEDIACGHQVTAIYLSPSQFGEYTGYTVSAIKGTFRVTANAQVEIKPSPPAPPVP